MDRSFSGIGFFELIQVIDLAIFVSHHDRLDVVPAPKGPDVADVDQVAVLDREIGVVKEGATAWLVADGKDSVGFVSGLDHIFCTVRWLKGKAGLYFCSLLPDHLHCHGACLSPCYFRPKVPLKINLHLCQIQAQFGCCRSGNGRYNFEGDFLCDQVALIRPFLGN
ncbi:MAG: hypothetical protein DWI24_06065 [Planctomycetota bacterium]|nr:MAG: hypothetical protein DWI24_06065 [Planctomycetota bacterium]